MSLSEREDRPARSIGAAVDLGTAGSAVTALHGSVFIGIDVGGVDSENTYCGNRPAGQNSASTPCGVSSKVDIMQFGIPTYFIVVTPVFWSRACHIDQRIGNQEQAPPAWPRPSLAAGA